MHTFYPLNFNNYANRHQAGLYSKIFLKEFAISGGRFVKNLGGKISSRKLAIVAVDANYGKDKSFVPELH